MFSAFLSSLACEKGFLFCLHYVYTLLLPIYVYLHVSNAGNVSSMISVLYSTDDAPLQVVAPPTFNNISGIPPTTLGETHFGLQKRPVGANLENFLFVGEQESNINEALFLGGIFQDDSSTGCVTL
jgi:hypothetical protein